MRPVPRITLLLVAMIVLAAVVNGCASPKGSAPTSLEGSWVVESFGAPNGLVPADSAATSDLTLKAGQASGSGGVNSFSGTYKFPGDGKILFGPLAATQKAGPPAAMAQESKFFSALELAKSFEINEGKLVLSDLGNNTLVVLKPK
jgi:putative lipoprotein